MRALVVEKVVFQKKVVDSLFSYSAMAYPNEGILLLRGKSKKGVVEVTGVVVPPLAAHGAAFSSFNWWMLPVDLSYLGVAHSHPSGNFNPSHQDLLHATGRIMVIMGYPYATVDNLGVYNHRGERIPFEVE
ncbi:MAG: Mov34/MPN/PAD-1 family protein [Nitrososphaerota archaeon]|nr:Mov34/MPN/PAD-1 family protein [Nitrososphaerota archaeon]MDG6964428.1 Mov34/MPN/PAD-1 family protein [Nitrososphaerota archaeon]MDG6974229.1 Mov34/MPN/PAD-1 family protein [Nitrososphaerota archaeon]MDG6974790.1 Mov34/MPN/PAD-1 family protein [Nitrososphaerota archaeon]MDG7010358.1 Mov34/MPN/PAD-1 family protein [Nitrososphaerota archaeon]